MLSQGEPREAAVNLNRPKRPSSTTHCRLTPPHLCPHLYRFTDFAGFCTNDPTPIPAYVGVFPLDQIADVGVNVNRYFKLFSREIIFEVLQPNMITVPERHRQTDRQTTYFGITALCVASRS